MTEGEISQEQMLEEQKANCIFCKIIKGEIPSKKVYEDEKIVAILDINPAVKGHTLLLTKEHYPIMPLLPPEEFDHLFGTTAALSGAVREGSLAEACTTFIANGAVAGQQSPHFLFHLIPREESDGLQNFEIPENNAEQGEVGPLLQKNLPAVMQQHLQKTGKLSLLRPEQEAPEKETPQEQPETQAEPSPVEVNELLASLINENPALKEEIINHPERLKERLSKDPQLAELFQHVNLERLRIALAAQAEGEAPPEKEEEPTKEEMGAPAQAEEERLTPARELSLQEIFAFIDAKPRLREYILHDPEGLKRLIPQNRRLAAFFEGSSPNAIIQAYQEYAKEEQGTHVTVEPDERQAPSRPATRPDGPSRQEAEEARRETIGLDEKAIDKVSRLFR